jgi:hypothetical protein
MSGQRRHQLLSQASRGSEGAKQELREHARFMANKEELELSKPKTNTIVKVAGVFGGLWLIWFSFVAAAACTIGYVIFHFIAKFW